MVIFSAKSKYTVNRESEGTIEGYRIALKHFRRLVDLDSIRGKSWVRKVRSLCLLIDQIEATQTTSNDTNTTNMEL